jgi:16S rRNA processing protein RimM
MTVAPRWIPLAEVARPHGVKGELRLKVYNQDSDILLDQDDVHLRLKDGTEQDVSVDRARRADDAILMKLHSVDDRDRADELRGAVISVDRRAFPPAEDGEFYVCDILGAKVTVEAGAHLGEVKELRSYPTVDVLVIKAADGGKDWEIPLVAELVTRLVADTDAAAREVVIRSVDGIER